MTTINNILKYTHDKIDRGSIINIMEYPEKYDMNDKSIKLLQNIKELINEYLTEKVKNRNVLSNQEAVINFAKSKLNGSANEKFLIFYLNTKNEVIHYDIHAEGTINNILVYPRRIIKDALDNNAAGIILVHNHPSGHTYPSKEDKIITDRMKDCLKVIDVNLLDHIIIGNNDYYSFQENEFCIKH